MVAIIICVATESCTTGADESSDAQQSPRLTLEQAAKAEQALQYSIAALTLTRLLLRVESDRVSTLEPVSEPTPIAARLL